MNKETVHSVPEKKHIQKHNTIIFSHKRKNQWRWPDKPQKKRGEKTKTNMTKKERERKKWKHQGLVQKEITKTNKTLTHL